MEIRKMQKSDLNSLLKLYEQLDIKNKALSMERAENVWQQITQNPNIIYLVAVENQTVVSTCYLVIIPNLTNLGRPICFIENVVTDIQYRNQGLAKKIIMHAVDIAKEHNCYKVILQSGMERTQAHKLYESLGFNGESKKAFDMRL